jgi:hypothetical protein
MRIFLGAGFFPGNRLAKDSWSMGIHFPVSGVIRGEREPGWGFLGYRSVNV